jgi:O-antigen/teichoic acid export membrane protein
MTRHTFLLDVAKITSATALAQVISLATTPIFTRLFEPAAVGTAAVFMSIVFCIAPVSNLRYNHAIVLAKDDNESFNIAVLSFLLTAAVSVCLLFPFLVFGKCPIFSFNNPELKPLLWLVPITVFVRGIYSVLLMETSRKRSFGVQGYSRVLQILSERILVLGTGLLGWVGATTIIIGRLISYFFEAIPFHQIARSFIKKYRSLSLRSLRDTAIAHRQFPMYANWTNITANLSAYISIFIIAFFFTAEFTGLYAMSERLLLLPLYVFGDSIKSVYYQKAASQREDRAELKAFYLQLRKRLVAYSLFPAVLLLFFGPQIFSLFLGEEWEIAGSIAGIMCLIAFFQFISSPIMSLVNVVGKQRQFLLFTILLLCARCLSFILGGLEGKPMLGVWLFSISGSLIYIAINHWMDRMLHASSSEPLFQISKYGSLSLLLLLCVFFGERLFPIPIILPFALICASFLYYSIAVRSVEGESMGAVIKKLTNRGANG